jgi:signal transduction histidine kinase
VGRGGDEIDDLSANVNETLRRIQQDIVAANRVNGSMSHQLLAPLRRVRNMSHVLAERLKAMSAKESEIDRRYGVALLRVSEELEQASIELGHVVRTGEGLQSLLIANRRRKKHELNDLVDLHEVCSVTAARFRPKAAQRNIAIGVDAEVIDIHSSGYVVEQILSNMIDNAIIYGPRTA